MFCHERYSLLCSERKNSTIVSTRARKRWGRKREKREQVIACTMIEQAMPRQGKRWHPSADSVVDGEHQRCVLRSSRPDTFCRVLLHISEQIGRASCRERV